MAITKNPERLRRMQEIAAQFDNYRKGVDAVFAMKREQDKLVSDTLDPSGTAARANFDTLIANATREQECRNSPILRGTPSRR